MADYVYGLGIDEPLRMRRDLNNDGYFNTVSETFFYYENGIGSIYALADGAGNVVERYDYTTYGEVGVYGADGVTEREESLVGNVYGFQGRRIDWETAAVMQSPLYYFRHRIYSPTLQRFLQSKDLYETNYSALLNSPTNCIDALGLQATKSSRDVEKQAKRFLLNKPLESYRNLEELNTEYNKRLKGIQQEIDSVRAKYAGDLSTLFELLLKAKTFVSEWEDPRRFEEALQKILRRDRDFLSKLERYPGLRRFVRSVRRYDKQTIWKVYIDAIYVNKLIEVREQLSQLLDERAGIWQTEKSLASEKHAASVAKRIREGEAQLIEEEKKQEKAEVKSAEITRWLNKAREIVKQAHQAKRLWDEWKAKVARLSWEQLSEMIKRWHKDFQGAVHSNANILKQFCKSVDWYYGVALDPLRYITANILGMVIAKHLESKIWKGIYSNLLYYPFFYRALVAKGRLELLRRWRKWRAERQKARLLNKGKTK